MRRGRHVAYIAFIPIFLALSACTRPQVGAAAVETDVQALLANLDRAQNAGDIDAFAELIAEDIVFMPPESRSVVGKPAVLDFYHGLFAQAVLTIRHEAEESLAEGPLVVQRGRAIGSFRSNAGGGEVPFDNKYLYVLRREDDGRLRFSRVIFNSNTAPMPGR